MLVDPTTRCWAVTRVACWAAPSVCQTAEHLDGCLAERKAEQTVARWVDHWVGSLGPHWVEHSVGHSAASMVALSVPKRAVRKDESSVAVKVLRSADHSVDCSVVTKADY